MAYEMRIEEGDGTSHRETIFATSKKTSKEKHTLKAKTCSCKEEEKEEDEEEFLINNFPTSRENENRYGENQR